MKTHALRVAAFLLLTFIGAGAHAEILRFDFRGPTASIGNWVGPGPKPTSFEISFTVDTLSFTSSEIRYFTETPPYDGSPDGTGEIAGFVFRGVDVLSISFRANGQELWNDPAGLKILFGGDVVGDPPTPGFCLCGFGYEPNSLGQSVSMSYDKKLLPRSQLGDDPLANILLGQTPIPAQGGVIVEGEWGTIIGDDFVYVSVVVPTPPTVVIGGCDSGVPNYNVLPGTTLNDQIAQCPAPTAKGSRSKFVDCVQELTRTWKRTGLISGAQKGAIMRCARKTR